MKTFLGIVGTNSDKSTNRQLMQYIQKHFAEKAEIEIVDLKNMPAFNKPNMDDPVPAEIEELADKITEADGVIISTPEYNHSIPAILKSTLEWLSYSTHPFINKPVMITGASYGKLGSSRAQAHLRQILDSPEIKARIMPSSEFLIGESLQAFDHNGDLKATDKVEELEAIFEDFLLFVDITNQLVNTQEAHQKQARKFSWKDN